MSTEPAGGMVITPLDELEADIIACRRCPRLVRWRQRTAREKRRAFRGEEYWAKPVPGFGDPDARVLVVGLAPGAHGSNRTGRMFTGDASGDFLFPALHRVGFASRPVSLSPDDGLVLCDLFITAVCRCAPPGNRPTRAEIVHCLPYLNEELVLLERTRLIVALGRIAYEAVTRSIVAPGPGSKPPPFAHGARWKAVHPAQTGAPPVWVLASYHPSRQNTQTGRLTRSMFDRIWTTAGEIIRSPDLF